MKGAAADTIEPKGPDARSRPTAWEPGTLWDNQKVGSFREHPNLLWSEE